MLNVSDDDAISAGAARELRQAALQLKRHELMVGVPLAILAVPAIIAGLMYPAFGMLILGGVAVILWVGRAAVEFVRLRRMDPVEHWRADQRELMEETTGRAEHIARSSKVIPVATLTLMAATFLVTALQLAGPGIRDSIPLAALVKPAVRDGEWWRLLSAAFLHGNLLHVLGNMSALVNLGGLIETYDRPIRLPLVYLASVVAGSIASTLLLAAPSVGASGGVVGLAGYFVVSSRLRSDGTPVWVRKQVIGMLAATAAMGVAAFAFIDNAAHVGGALGGMGVGWLSARANAADDRRAMLDKAGWASAAVLAAAAVFTAARLLRWV